MRLSTLIGFVPCALALALAGCPGKDTGPSDTTDDSDSTIDDTYTPPVDGDGDGVTSADGDCDDSDPSVYTGRVEDCDGKDNNCNDLIDEGLPDTDGDRTADCLDVEDCDGVDNDGDGQVDEDFADSDGDGVADCVGTESCDGVDNDGDGQIDEGYDLDGDGYTQCGTDASPADCDDHDPSANPGQTEVESDGVDNDCDGIADEGSWRAGDLVVTEVMNNPGNVPDPDGEWIELYNASTRTLTVNGLTILTNDNNHQITSTSSLSFAPGEFIVLGSNDNAASNGDVVLDYQYAGVSLSNDSDELSIIAGATTVDTVVWDDGATMPDPQGATIGTDHGIYSASLNDNAAIWCAATDPWGFTNGDKGSPGTANEYCSNIDHDGDGYTPDMGDCDDGDATIYPGAFESDPSIDHDCDGVAEQAPLADARVIGTSHLSCSSITLDGSGSFDPQGTAITYDWSLTSAPSGSIRTTSDITTTTDSQPTFNPDIPGDYTFSLTVNDGGADSLPSSVTVTVTPRAGNTDPIASAGADQTGSGSANCDAISYGASWDCDTCTSSSYTLNATGSTDPDGDTMLYAWVVTSGSTYGSLSASSGSTTTLTVSGVAPTAASTSTTETVDITLTATDCMGGSDSDILSVTYTCTGT